MASSPASGANPSAAPGSNLRPTRASKTTLARDRLSWLSHTLRLTHGFTLRLTLGHTLGLTLQRALRW